jgi:class 3 adenylate cyclase/tetratricopeptide (TPR) repeat protein
VAPARAASTTSAVRKQVTALFADLAGSTAFVERLDGETVRAAMLPYFELLRSSVEEHAGTVAKFTGDGVLALFGVPAVAEDDALRAIAAGLDLQRRFQAFAAQIHDRHGVELGLRIGVNTGELVVGEADVEYVGDVLNTAARLEAVCPPGSVLVGEDTWRLTRTTVAYEVLGAVRVKGKADEIATFRVVEGSTIRERPTPFVGRLEELDTLQSAFAEAVAHSAARLATVIGVPGVGKSRLAQELRSRTTARSFELRFDRRDSTAFTATVELVRQLSGSSEPDDIGRLAVGHPEAARLGPALASLLGHGEPRTTEESFWAVRRLLELVAADGPVIVVLDDVHWAPTSFWDLLDHLVAWTAAPVLLVALGRPELRELRPELTQTGRRVGDVIALEGLDPDSTRELAARILEIDPLPADLDGPLTGSTGGNPLFVRELVNMLVLDGVLARDGDQWRLTLDSDAIDVPPTVLSLLASRVERLPVDERRVMELAAVIGTDFDRRTLAAVADGELVGRLGALVDRLRRENLIEPTGASIGDDPVFRFQHALLRDAAYLRLLKVHRAELHERVGRHVERSDLAHEELDVVVAHHYEQVWRYRSELGTLDDAVSALAAAAAARLRSAAERALEREDLPSTGGYALRALALVDDASESLRDELLLLGCEALLSSGDVIRGAPLVDELRLRATDLRLAAWADAFRAQLWSMTHPDRLTEAADVADAAALRLDALGDQGGVAKARLVRASCLAHMGRIGDCEEELDLALAAARSAGDRRRTAAVLGAAPIAALWGPSPVARAGGRCLDVLRLLRVTTASPSVETTSIRCQGVLDALRGRFESARAKLETSSNAARDLGLGQAVFETEYFAGFVELLAGDPAAAEPHLRTARDGLGRLGIGADAGQAGALLARALHLQGHIDEADRVASDALESAGENLQTAMASRAALAEIRASQGRAAEAEQLVADALATAERTDVVLDHALTLLAAARVARGDPELAVRRSGAAAALLEAKGVDAAVIRSHTTWHTGSER